MPPAVGPFNVAMVTIDKNDLAEGIVQFGVSPSTGFIGNVYGCCYSVCIG